MSDPTWMKRPNCPGLWLCVGSGVLRGMVSGLPLTQQDIDRGAPHETCMVYGPIPDMPKEQRRAASEKPGDAKE